MSATPTAMTPEEIDALEPEYIGLTWKHVCGGYGPKAHGPECATPLGLPRFIAPKYTIGYAVAQWCMEELRGLDGGKWEFTPEQLRFILWWYAVDERGRFIYRTGVLQRLKGWGKDPLASILCLVEFVGPSQFKCFNPNALGGCEARPHPRSWVQVAAVSRDQTRNTMTLIPLLMTEDFVKRYGIKVGLEVLRAHRGRCRFEAVTSSHRALEGGRSTFVILNETHHWVRGNGGDLMYETIDGNTTKMDCRYLAITNAYIPGEDSVAEKMRLAWEKIESGHGDPDTDAGFYYDSIEAHPKTPLTRKALEIVIPKIRGDAHWLVIDAIAKSVANTSISPSRSRRMWLNQIVAAEDALYRPEHLLAIERPDATLRAGDEVFLGFDGSRYEDSTALVAIRLRDRTTFLVGLWEKPHTWNEEERGRWEVNAEDVDSMVRWAFGTYKVLGFFADMNLWESHVLQWSNDFGDRLKVKAKQGSPIAFDMRNMVAESTRAHERLMSAIINEHVFFDGDLTLKRHTNNARKKTVNIGKEFGTYFRKESPDSTRKIDAYAAWVLAHEAMSRYLTAPLEEKRVTGAGWFL